MKTATYRKDERTYEYVGPKRPPDAVAVANEPARIKRTTPLDQQDDASLIHALYMQTNAGYRPHEDGSCGHPSRGGMNCAACVDAELLRRGVDAAKYVPQQGGRSLVPKYERDGSGRLFRTK